MQSSSEVMMKQFSCGDVVPDCVAKFEGADEDEILASVAEHARRDHGMVEIPPSVIAQVRAKITESAAP